MERNVNVITDIDGKKIVVINDIRFKGKTKEEWKEIETYLKEYIGKLYLYDFFRTKKEMSSPL